MGYDYSCRCNEACVADNGIRFYANELYYVDEDYDGEWIYEVYSSTGRFLAWTSVGFLEEFFTFLDNPLEEVNKMFNIIMDGRVYQV